MKQLIFLAAVIFLSGCVSVEVESTGNKSAASLRPLIPVEDIEPGMTPQDVKRILGAELIIGYKASETAPGAYEPVSVSSPHKTENFSVNGTEYRADYYYTKVFKADGMVSREELVPVVYRNNAVAGVGWDFKRDLTEGI